MKSGLASERVTSESDGPVASPPRSTTGEGGRGGDAPFAMRPDFGGAFGGLLGVFPRCGRDAGITGGGRNGRSL